LKTTPPRVLIELAIEAAPRIVLEAEPTEKARLAYWLLETPEILRLLEDAADLAEQMRQEA
jgi:hypothetical protein